MPEEVTPHGRTLRLPANTPEAREILKALASEPRLRILELISHELLNVSEIAEALDVPVSTATRDISILEEAGLLRSELKPASRGLQKVCMRVHDTILIELPARNRAADGEEIEISMPVGAYAECDVVPTCGLTSEASIIGLFDDPASFYEPERVQAQLMWFHQGFVKYRFPNRLPPQVSVDSVRVSLELCSEAPLHHDDWPSDITVWINDVEIGTWTSPADFGGQRGKLTPDWWESRNSQYGLLKVWLVNEEGSFVDGLEVSSVGLEDLHLTDHATISVGIGVKEDAENVGGVNIFGRHFGNYAQDIVLRLRYHQRQRK
jgi:predicted transcriptional regulator